MSQVNAKPGNPAAVVALALGAAGIPVFILFGPSIITWIVALAAIITGSIAVRRARQGASGLALAVVGIVLGSFSLLMAVIFTVMLLTRPFR